MSIKLVVLDMAGTTVEDDNQVAVAFQQALQQYGYEVPAAAIMPLMGYEKQLAIRHILEVYEPVAEKITAMLVGNIHRVFVQQMKTHYGTSAALRFLPGVEATLGILHHQHISIGVNTGFSREIAEIILARLQWREKGLVDYLVASDEVPRGRPYPDMIHRLMAKAGVTDSQQVVKVGDTAVDIREGLQAGCRYSIGITTGAFTREQLAPYQPTHIIDNLAELPDILQLS